MALMAPAPRWRAITGSAGRTAMLQLAGFAALAALLGLAPLPWAALTLIGVGLALAVAVRPGFGLIALALLLPFGGVTPLSAGGGNAVDLLAATIGASWLAGQIARRKIIFRPPPLTNSLALLLWSAGLSLTVAASWAEGAPELLKWAEFALLYVAATHILTTRAQLHWVIGALVAAGLAQVALGAYQFWGRVGPPAFALADGFVRAHGTLRQPNPYAGYLGYLAPAAASLAIAGLARWIERRERRALVGGLVGSAAAAALIVGIGLSWSRGGWLALVAALAVVGGLRNRRTALLALAVVIVLALIVGLAGVAWLPGPIAGRLQDLSDYFGGPDPARTEINDANFAVLERLAHWRAGLDMFADRPWLGVGIGNYSVAYADYAPPHWYEPLGHAHNIFINFLAETGVIGGVAFLLFWLAAWRLTWQVGRRAAARGDRFAAALALGVMGSLTYLTVHGLFDNLFVQHMQLQLALMLACVAVTDRSEATF